MISIGAARSARDQRSCRGRRRGDGSRPEVVAARRLGFELDHGVLPIQGPPGTGKTFTGSHMILELLKAGKKVGVTAVGHETIRNLLQAPCASAQPSKGSRASSACTRATRATGIPKSWSRSTTTIGSRGSFAAASTRCSAARHGFGRGRSFAPLRDVLFIDEAGQMSLADVLAVSAGAQSLVLLGDPQQLEQPQQASHPPGTQASALEHILAGDKTIAAGPRPVPPSDPSAAS